MAKVIEDLRERALKLYEGGHIHKVEYDALSTDIDIIEYSLTKLENRAKQFEKEKAKVFKIEAITKCTRNYTTEHAYVYKYGLLVAEGKYKWQNRPWQKFTYHEAVLDALKPMIRNEFIKVYESMNSVEEIENFLNKEKQSGE